MRYLGNKESILNEISDLLSSKGLLQKGYTYKDRVLRAAMVKVNE